MIENNDNLRDFYMKKLKENRIGTFFKPGIMSDYWENYVLVINAERIANGWKDI